ncbi:hemicentin-1-like, partial [Leptonychotes weddellii]|uniref:Hemicentin-1-like n=1 Tax=Leptonychotes weddellii TaxID=9713 RepID=A0A7F8QFK1_LEPWE
PPKVTVMPKNQSFTGGYEVSIRCSATGYPKPKITWTINDMFIMGSHRYRMTSEGTLIIKNAVPKDAGIYGCLASNSAGTDKQTSTLRYIEAPKLIVVQSELLVALGDTTVMECKTSGIPPPQVKWFKGTPKPTIRWIWNGRELTGREPGISTLEDGTLLVIASVTPSDNGEYICVAVNEAGTTEKKYNLKVHVPPVIKDKEQITNVSVLVNQLTNLFCEVEGTPSPIIMWYKDDIQVTESSTIQIVNNGKILKLFKVTPEDAGRYSCKAVNIAGTSQKYFNIDVLVPPTIIGANSPNEVSVVFNHDITLECQVKGTPFPVIHWFKDGKPLFLEDPNIELLDRGQVLHLKDARRSDKGRYQCTVSNAVGKQAKDIKLTIY